MRKLLPFFLLVLTSISFGQIDVVTEAAKPLIGDASQTEIEYNKFSDITSVSSKRQQLTASKYAILFPDASFRVDGLFIGERNTKLAKYYLTFTFVSSDWRFLKTENELYVIADNTRLRFGSGKRDGDVLSGRSKVQVRETLSYTLTQEQMETIGRSKMVELQISGFETVFSTSDQQQFLNVVAGVASKSPTK